MKVLILGSLLAITVTRTVAAASVSGESNDYQSFPGKDWPLHDGHWGNSRYSSLKEINTRDIKAVGGAWRVELQGGITRSSPIVQNGRMFIAAGGSLLAANVKFMAIEGAGSGGLYALNPKTGEVVWRYVPEGAGVSNLNKGPAAGDGKVFLGLADAHVVAVDQKTGKVVWNTLAGADPLPSGEFIGAAPVYAAGLVLVGIGSGDAGISGRVVALDAKSGAKRWEFRSIPGPGEAGHESWPSDNESWKQGGGGIWANVAVDPNLGLIYFGTGNAFPMLGGEVRAGDNLYTASLMAIDLRTGKYRWHYQFTHHDTWESDLGAPTVLYNATVNGKTVPAIAAMRTDGNLLMFNRATGAPLQEMEERPVRQVDRMHSAKTQPFPKGADQVGFACAQQSLTPSGFKLGCFFDAVDYTDPNMMLPTSATRSAPMSYDPDTRQFYITGAVGAGWTRRASNPYFFSGGITPVPGVTSYGVLVAFDASSHKITWQKKMPSAAINNGSGAMTTAGGLLFHGEPDGNLQAYDAKNGDLLWQFQTGEPIGGPVSTYEIGGKQYVAVVAGSHVWAFAIGGKLEQGPARQVVAQGSGFSGRIVPTSKIQMGEEQDSVIGPSIKEKFKDDYALVPRRAKIKVGAVVTWTNTSSLTRDATAQDGSWTTGPIQPGKSGSVTFDKPGTYIYISKAHPWVYGELTVE
jgi:quinohemoprotein ethanol dehydrogenase